MEIMNRVDRGLQRASLNHLPNVFEPSERKKNNISLFSFLFNKKHILKTKEIH